MRRRDLLRRGGATALALEHRLMSKYTSFVAVEKKIRSNVSLPLETILVPSEMPEGVRYESIFGEATLSMDRIKPGDPVLAVRAPEEALAVLEKFAAPFPDMSYVPVSLPCPECSHSFWFTSAMVPLS